MSRRLHENYQQRSSYFLLRITFLSIFISTIFLTIGKKAVLKQYYSIVDFQTGIFNPLNTGGGEIFPEHISDGVAKNISLLSSSRSNNANNKERRKRFHGDATFKYFNPVQITLVASQTTSFTEVNASVSSILKNVPSTRIYLVYFSTEPKKTILHLVPDHNVITSRRPYDDPILAFSATSSRRVNGDTRSHSNFKYETQSIAVILRAGVLISPHAVPWLIAAHKKYASRPDIAAFALDRVDIFRRISRASPDHSVQAWRVLNITNSSTSSALAQRMLPSAHALVLNPNPKLNVWSVFQEWLSLRRADWHKYTRGPGVDGTPLGRSTLSDSNWTRAEWNVWFSKFVHEYRLCVIFPIVPSGKLVASDESELLQGEMPHWNLRNKIPVFYGDGLKVPQSYFGDRTILHFENISRAHDNTISITVVNKDFVHTARSWLCNVDIGNFRPPGLVWAATDKVSRNEFSALNGSSTVFLRNIQGAKQNGNEYGNPGYWKLMLERTILITDILSRGVAVFAFETDATWLEDPWPHIEALIDQEADIVGTINTRADVSGNFLYLRPTLPTRRLWIEMSERFGAAYKQAHFETKAANSKTYIQNDQTLMSQLILRNESWRTSYPLNFLTLDMEKFVDGRWYMSEEGFYKSTRSRSPIVINNNFIVGVAEKTKRAKRFGHWFWDEALRRCLRTETVKALRF